MPNCELMKHLKSPQILAGNHKLLAVSNSDKPECVDNDMVAWEKIKSHSHNRTAS